MSSPFGVRFFTRGYERTHREMSSIEQKGKTINTGFVKMGRTGANVGPMVARGFTALKSSMSASLGILRSFVGLTVKVTAALAVVGGVVAGVGVALATKFAKGLMATRESFYLIETAMTGVVKNAGQVRKISEWAMGYAAKYPAMYSDVMTSMKGLAMMPALKPIFTKASVRDMEKIMNIVQGLAALDPQQGVKGALLAIREALAGQWRTLQYRFEIRPQAVASAAGLSMDEIKNMPDKAIEALDAFVRLNVGADTLRKSAQSLGVQWGNLSDKYEIWLNTVAQYGAYRKLVGFLSKMNDVWDKMLASDATKRLGQNISRVFEGAIEGLERTMMGIDWEGSGLFDGLVEAGKKVIAKLRNIMVDAKDIFAAALKVVMGYVRQALLSSVKNVFWPVGVEIAKAIGDAFVETMRDHPMTTWLLSMAAGGMTGGVPGALAGGSISALALAAQGVGDLIGKGKGKGDGGGAPFVRKPIPRRTEGANNLKTLGAAIKAFAAKYEGSLPEAKGIENVDTIEEQVKKVVQARTRLRVAEAMGVKSLVGSLRSQLAYEERLLEYHKKAAKWETDPKRGKRESQLRSELSTMGGSLSVDELVKKRSELARLESQRKRDVGDVTRYTGVEIERRAADAAKKQNDLKGKLLGVEERIRKMKQEGGEDETQLIAAQKEMLSLMKERSAAEAKFINAKRKQLEIQKQLQRLEMMKGAPGQVGVSALEKTQGHFQSFFEGWMKKTSVRRRYGGAELPGMRGVTWREGAEKSRERETKGIPVFSLLREKMLRQKLEGAESPEARQMLLEKLYRTNVDQFQGARGKGAKGAQFLEANELMSQLQDVESQLLQEQITLTKEQAENAKNAVAELKKANGLLSEISTKAGLGAGGSSSSGGGSPEAAPSINSFMGKVNQVLWSPT